MVSNRIEKLSEDLGEARVRQHYDSKSIADLNTELSETKNLLETRTRRLVALENEISILKSSSIGDEIWLIQQQLEKEQERSKNCMFKLVHMY
jgi:predicted  nucleic acid-binding Zn-ribbon protein